MEKRYFMILDFGTGAGRCSLVDAEGEGHIAVQREWFFDAPPEAQPGGFCFDPDRFWSILGETAREAMARGGIKPSQVVAVSATSIREGFVLLDGEGREIFAVPNRDGRAITEAREIGDAYGYALNDLSGHWPGSIFAPCRFLWLKRHQPDILERARTFLMINDWVLYRLCGEKRCEPTNGSETAVYDIRNHCWAAEMIRTLDMPLEIFPPIARAGEVLGVVTQAAAEATGLSAGTPVIVSGADTQCGVLGSGGMQPGEAVIVAGTSTPIQMVLDEPTIDSQVRTWTGPHVVPGFWVLESNAGITGSILRWFRDSFCAEEKARAAAAGRDPYALMEELARQSPIGSAGVTCLMGARLMNARLVASSPTVAGFTTAFPRAMVAEVDSRKHFIRSILECFAFSARANCAQLEKVSGMPLKRILVCGGSSASDFWMQMLADNLGMAVERPREKEASAIGAAICSGVGVKVYDNFARGVDVQVKPGGRFEPGAANRGAYDAAYELWQQLRNL